MATKPDPVVLGDWGSTVLKERARRVGGKTHTTLTIRAEPVVIDGALDPQTLGRAFAEAMKLGLQGQIRAITAHPSPATRARRERAVRAIATGKRWAVKQYSGGRLGVKLPRPEGALFNDSGRFADGITVSAIANGWIINFPANRMNRSDFALGRFEWMVEKLRSLVPGLRDPKTLVDGIIEQMPDETVLALKAASAGRSNPALRVSLAHKLGKAPGMLQGQLDDAIDDVANARDELLDRLEQTLGYGADAVEEQQERGAEDDR